MFSLKIITKDLNSVLFSKVHLSTKSSTWSNKLFFLKKVIDYVYKIPKKYANIVFKKIKIVILFKNIKKMDS